MTTPIFCCQKSIQLYIYSFFLNHSEVEAKNSKRYDDLKNIGDDTGLKPDDLSSATSETPILVSPKTGKVLHNLTSF